MLFISPIPLSKEREGDLNTLLQNSLLIHSCWRLALQSYRGNATLHFALSHNALARRRKLLKVIASSLMGPLSHSFEML